MTKTKAEVLEERDNLVATLTEEGMCTPRFQHVLRKLWNNGVRGILRYEPTGQYVQARNFCANEYWCENQAAELVNKYGLTLPGPEFLEVLKRYEAGEDIDNLQGYIDIVQELAKDKEE